MDRELVLPVAAHRVVTQDEHVLGVIVELFGKAFRHGEEDMRRLGRPIM
jgi:hypothetical protein